MDPVGGARGSALAVVVALSSAVAIGGTGHELGVEASTSGAQYLPVGSGTPSLGPRFGLSFENYRSTTVNVQDLYVRIGAVQVPGDWRVSVEDPVYTPLGISTTFTPAADAWNRITFNPPVPMAHLDALLFVFEPVSTGNFQIVGSNRQHRGPTQTGGVSYDGELMPSLAIKMAGSGPWYGAAEPVYVVTLAGETDPLAPASCQGADRIAVSGDPYFERIAVTNANGQSLAQTFFTFPWDATSTGEQLESFSLGVDPASGTTYEVTGPSIPTRTGTVSPASLSACIYAQSALSNPELDTVAITSTGAVTWYAESASPTPLAECDPVARATFGGSAGAAVIGGVAHPEWDFELKYTTNPTLTEWFADSDHDGFGAPGPVFCPTPPGFVRNSEDCDDTRADVFPDAGERCDGVDDNCDGVVDSADPKMRRELCENQSGVCVNTRHVPAQCVDGGWLACRPELQRSTYEAVEQTCDGLDNDCDGQVDNGLQAPACAKQQGVCAGSSVAACVNGTWPECTAVDYGPTYEEVEISCDGLDNDCDGLVDAEDADRGTPACEREWGVCARAVHEISQCTASGWQACGAREYGPNFENVETSCDGLDNDCDGLLDQFDPDLVIPLCPNQQGVCAGSVHVRDQCSPAGWAACTAAQFGAKYEQTESACDDLDNDCDGTIDEGCSAWGCTQSGGWLGWPALLLVVVAFGRRGIRSTRTAG